MFKKVYIEIGNMCNLHCQFCSIGTRKKELMSKEKFSIIAKEVKEFSDYIYLHVKGEPLLHPELVEILKVCEENNLQVNITTNGTKINEKMEIFKKSSCIRQVNISAHALSEIATSDEKNYLDGLFKLIELAKSEKKFYVSIRLWIKNDEINNKVLNFLKSKYDIKDNKITDGVYLSVDEEFTWPSLENEYVGEVGKCYGARNQIAILANGDVVPCCLDCDGVIVLGNCLNEKLSDILNTQRYLNIKKGFENKKVVEELCQKCSYRLKFK